MHGFRTTLVVIATQGSKSWFGYYVWVRPHISTAGPNKNTL
jgi:hypothetical protein